MHLYALVPAGTGPAPAPGAGLAGALVPAGVLRDLTLQRPSAAQLWDVAAAVLAVGWRALASVKQLLPQQDENEAEAAVEVGPPRWQSPCLAPLRGLPLLATYI